MRIARRVAVAAWFVLAGLVAGGICVGLGGCATAGPSYAADGAGARSSFAPSSNIALLADGTWSASSPQTFATSGVDITDERSSAIMPENVNGFRATGDSVTFLSGGSLDAAFTIQLSDGSVERWEVSRLVADKGDFYAAMEMIAPVLAGALEALGDDATAQVVEQLRTFREVAPAAIQGAVDVLIQAITGSAF